MSWMAKLYETYASAERKETDKSRLPPISHSARDAHVEIVLDGNGIFRRAILLRETTEYGEKPIPTLVPVTENSMGRTSGIAPHPLCEELGYCAVDLMQVSGNKERKNKEYLDQINKWRLFAKSINGENKLNAICQYLSKETLWKDVSSQIKFPIRFRNQRKTTTTKLEKTFIRWRVEVSGVAATGTWEDENLIRSWIEFDAKENAKFGYCVAFGKSLRVATKQPKFLRYSGDKAKLISSNDKNGCTYTYRGRFLEAEQAAEVGFEYTQKAHNVLRWLIKRQQGFRVNNQVFLAWAVSGRDIPEPKKSLYDLLNPAILEEDLTYVINDNQEKKEKSDHTRDIGEHYARSLSRCIAGYKSELGDDESIVIMGLDSATSGRMSINFYREYFAYQYLEKIESWHSDFAWPQRHYKNQEKNVVSWFPSVPKLYQIAEVVYGGAVSDSLNKSTIERVMPCIVDRQPLPRDLMLQAVQQASNPNSYGSDEIWKWEQNIGVACSLVKGYHSNRNPNKAEWEEYQMTLERERSSRDYLFGRLLAVAEKIEGKALQNANEKRITSAERLMQRFSQKPCSTWKIIDESLRPYKNRLRSSDDAPLLYYWDREIQEICALFNTDDFIRDDQLGGEYLLGYYCQKHYRKPKSENPDDTSDPATQPEN